MDRLAIDAVFVDYRRIKGRKVHQIVFEVPSEKWPEVYRVLGEPTIDTSDWFAIAKMTGAAPQENKGGRLAQKAGILCNETAFQRFIAEAYGWQPEFLASSDPPREIAAQFIYDLCDIDSRAFLDHDDNAARIFRDLDIEYRNWLNGVSPPGTPPVRGSAPSLPNVSAGTTSRPVSADASHREEEKV